MYFLFKTASHPRMSPVGTISDEKSRIGLPYSPNRSKTLFLGGGKGRGVGGYFNCFFFVFVHLTS